MVLSDQIESIKEALEREDRKALILLVQKIHAADLADMIEQIDSKTRHELVTMVPELFDGDVLIDLDESLLEEIIEELDHKRIATAIRDVEPYELVDIIEDLAVEQKKVILENLPKKDQRTLEKLLSYPKDSAGRLMQSDIVTFSQDKTVGDIIDGLRNMKKLPEKFYHITLVDQQKKPTGLVMLSKVLSSKRDKILFELREETLHVLSTHDSLEDVAYAFNQYHLISAPIVDKANNLVGVITIDEAIEIMEEQADEDIKKLAGVGSESLTESTGMIVIRRFPWLLVNLFTAILASFVIAQFETTLSKFVALAILMPIVASMGGNAGTQSLTVAVRALATRDLTATNIWRIIRREILVGLANGACFALITGLISYYWFDSVLLGLIIGASMIINLIVAGFVGIVIPIFLNARNIDPALASGTFVTTVTDVVGFFVFLSLAYLVLF